MIRIGSRGSKLALWQANWVKQQLTHRFPDLPVTIQIIKTTGDKLQEVATPTSTPKGLFTKEIQDAILRNEVDVAVHSLKDLPTDLHEGLHLTAITKRENVCDALISRQQEKLLELPYAARIGTSSTRRKSQLLSLRPDFKIIDLRGNVDTRLAKLDSGDYDAIVLAAAGLIRLELEDRICELIPIDLILPAVGQGALAIETRIDDKETQKHVRILNHKATRISCTAERVFLAALGGGCQLPIAAYGEVKGGKLNLRGSMASLNGSLIIKRAITGTAEEAEFLGQKLAEKLLAGGADKLIKEMKDSGHA